MNKNKLARQHGYFDWASLIRSADAAKKLRTELMSERAANAPLRQAVKDTELERAALAAERVRLAESLQNIAEHYRDRAVRSERDSVAARVIGGAYERHAAEVRAEVRNGADEKPKELEQ